MDSITRTGNNGIFKVECRITMCYSSESIAKRIAKSLEPDNYAFVISKVRGKSIVSVIVSESIPSLIHTVDDYLSCVGVAEKTLEIGEHPHKRKVSVTS